MVTVLPASAELKECLPVTGSTVYWPGPGVPLTCAKGVCVCPLNERQTIRAKIVDCSNCMYHARAYHGENETFRRPELLA